MAKNKVGTDPFLDALAVYKTELAKGSPEKQFNQIHKLVKELPDINHQDKSGMTYLSIAVRQFKDDIVQMLLENGADPNICDNLGVSPLAYAFLKQLPNTKRIIELLLQFGADPSLGKMPKHTSFYYAHTQAEPKWIDMLSRGECQITWGSICYRKHLGMMKMIYACDNCHFLFSRTKQPEQCPDCGKYAVREATEAEKTGI